MLDYRYSSTQGKAGSPDEMHVQENEYAGIDNA